MICKPQRRARRLGQCDLRQRVFAGLIEGRIGQETKAGKFDEDGGAADQGESWCGSSLFSILQARAGAGRVTR